MINKKDQQEISELKSEITKIKGRIGDIKFRNPPSKFSNKRDGRNVEAALIKSQEKLQGSVDQLNRLS